MVCPKCKYDTDREGVRFCGLDGTKLVPDSDVKCPSCGERQHHRLDRFCEKCGTPYEAEQVAAGGSNAQ
jgi:NADH pyrophosphatase NudC (nudix superfamily)